jgi:hypothetical protein
MVQVVQQAEQAAAAQQGSMDISEEQVALVVLELRVELRMPVAWLDTTPILQI